jgi:hypothetical protein
MAGVRMSYFNGDWRRRLHDRPGLFDNRRDAIKVLGLLVLLVGVGVVVIVVLILLVLIVTGVL